MPRRQPTSLLRRFVQLTAAETGTATPDALLLERYAATGDEEAFAVLLRRHVPMVTGVCRRLLRDRCDVEDAVQATFLVLARKAGTIRRSAAVGSWLHGVALRMARQLRSQATRHVPTTGTLPDRPAVDAADAVTWGELRTVLDEELARLPATWQAPLLLCLLQGLTQEEAAQQLAWSKSTLRRRLERGRQLLRVRLERRGITLSAVLVHPFLTEAPLPAEQVQGWLVRTLRHAQGLGERERVTILAATISRRLAVQRFL